jgi:hypothetical protein
LLQGIPPDNTLLYPFAQLAALVVATNPAT